MNQPAIRIEGLVKQFGRHRALDGIDLEVPEGSIFGFLGPNGAGKTTTIRILLGLARPTTGRAWILGHDALADPGRSNRQIGFLPDVPAFYPWMRAPEFMGYAASLHGLDPAKSTQRQQLLLELAGLADVRTPIGGYSRGMKQRLGLAQALINAPRLLILDEPTSALDPMGRHEVLKLIAKMSGRTTVFFSTHILSDVERICDRVAVLAQGRVVAAETTASLRSRYGGATKLRLELAERRADVADALRGESWLSGVEQQDAGWLLGVSDPDAAQHRLVQIAAEHQWGIKSLQPVTATLEEVFVHLVGAEATR